jgi:intracellular multiplication protein IcmJ
VLRLFIGIKRLRFRANDPRSKKADAEYLAKRPGVLARHKQTCAGCGYVSKVSRALDVHHLDDNHHNNEETNLVPACHLCHPYQHVGELGRRVGIGGEGLGKNSFVATIPEISARDLNLLQRAVGAALQDEKEVEIARKIMLAFLDRSKWTKSEFSSDSPRDFAAAMSMLTDAEYAARDDAVEDQRLVFQLPHLRVMGKQLMEDFPSMPLKSWQGVHDAAVAKGRATKAPEEVPAKPVAA